MVDGNRDNETLEREEQPVSKSQFATAETGHNHPKRHFNVKRIIVSLLFGLAFAFLLLRAFTIAFEVFTEGFIKPDFASYVPATIFFGVVFGAVLLIPANAPLRWLKNIGRTLGFALLAGLMILTLGLWEGQSVLMFPRIPVFEAQQQELRSTPRMQRIEVDGKYSGWYWQQVQEQAPLIIYFGGNGEDSSSITRFTEAAEESQTFSGYQVLMMDNPGAGQSVGKSSDNSIFEMAKKAYAYASTLQSVDPNRIVLMGWSLGTGTAVRLAAEVKPAGLILLSPFYNGTKMVNSFAKKMMDIDIPIPSVFINNPFKSDRYATQIDEKVLIVAAKDDEMIPYEQSERLAEKFVNADFVTIDQGGHSGTWEENAAQAAVAAYLQQIATQ